MAQPGASAPLDLIKLLDQAYKARKRKGHTRRRLLDIAREVLAWETKSVLAFEQRLGRR